MSKKSKKHRADDNGMVYSTNSSFEFVFEDAFEQETLPPEEQKLKVTLDAKKRKGKIVTLVSGFIGSEDDLKELAKVLKTKCGVGGSAKNNEIIIQGNFKEKVIEILKEAGYKIK